MSLGATGPAGLGAGHRGRDQVRGRQGRLRRRSPAATTSRTATRPRCSRKSRRACRAPCRWRRSTKHKAHAYYSSTGTWVELAAPGGSFRGFGADGGILQQTLDLDLVDTFDLPPGAVRGAALRLARRIFYFIGTSLATPHVSGVAAMLMQQGITNPAAIEAALEKFATDLGDAGRDNTFGFGLVEARNTLRGLGLAQMKTLGRLSCSRLASRLPRRRRSSAGSNDDTPAVSLRPFFVAERRAVRGEDRRSRRSSASRSSRSAAAACSSCSGTASTST